MSVFVLYFSLIEIIKYLFKVTHQVDYSIIIFHKKNSGLKNGSEFICGFWELKTSLWNSAGCIASYDSNGVFCSCNHLTDFSVLLVSLCFLYIKI